MLLFLQFSYSYSIEFLFKMNFSLSKDALSFLGEPFYTMVEELCGKEVVNLLKFQFIDSSMNLIDVNDVFFVLQFESNRTTSIKENLGISSIDDYGRYSFFVFPGIRLRVEKLVRSLRELNTFDTQSPELLQSLGISPKFIEKYPFIIDLVQCLQSDLLAGFSIDFLSNWTSNMIATSKNAFRYSESIKDFAISLYILGGPTLYEFLRLNLPGSVPNLTSVRSMISSSTHEFIEGEFQYSHFLDLIKPLDCKYVFCGEDSTAVIPKVSYDSHSNSFVGFTLPLKNGFPCCRYFSTTSLEALESWYNEVDQSSLLNIHVLQALTSRNQVALAPFLLSAYGTNNKYNAYDILSRWSQIFDILNAQGVRVLGFSTDGDPKNMRAMRNAMAFFSKDQSIFLNHPNIFTVTSLKVNKFYVEIPNNEQT